MHLFWDPRRPDVKAVQVCGPLTCRVSPREGEGGRGREREGREGEGGRERKGGVLLLRLRPGFLPLLSFDRGTKSKECARAKQ